MSGMVHLMMRMKSTKSNMSQLMRMVPVAMDGFVNIGMEIVIHSISRFFHSHFLIFQSLFHLRSFSFPFPFFIEKISITGGT